MSSRRNALRWGGVSIAALGLMLFTWNWTGAVFLNLSALHLSRGVSSAVSPVFPYVTDRAGRSQISEAVVWAQKGLRYNGKRDRLSCALLRAHYVSMAWQEAKAVVDAGSCDDVSVHGFTALWPIVEGLREFEHGDLAAARQHFRQAMIAGSGLLSLSLDPWLRESQSSVASPLAADTPRFLVGHKVDQAWQAAPLPVSDHWSLVGYDLAEEALETGQMVPVSLFWLPLKTDVPVPEDWQQAGSLWRQDALLANLLPDSGFQWSLDGLSGWSGPPGTSNVVYLERDGRTTLVQDIAANPDGGGAIVSSRVMPIGKNCAYLMGGWVTSDGGAPTFSVVWDGVRNGSGGPAYVNVMEGPRDLPWTHVSVLIPSSRSDALGMSIYASNWSSLWPEATHPPQRMAVDNVFLIAVSLPGMETCTFYQTVND